MRHLLGIILIAGSYGSVRAQVSGPINTGNVSGSSLFKDFSSLVIHSAILGDSLDIIVKTPLGYDQSQLNYPLLLALDADGSFGMATDIPTLLLFEGGAKRVVVAGISYRSFDKWLARRERDLTPTRDPQKPESGGASLFLESIHREIIPAIESKFRVGQSDRILYGHSYGGLFGLFVLFKSSDLFSTYILTSPSVDWHSESTLAIEDTFSKENKELASTVFISVGGKEDDIKRPLSNLVNQIKSRNYKSLNLHFEEIPGETHMGSMASAYTKALRWIFSQ
ncbi:MAG: alpha/beta hydrolase-fold protein [Cyclobacteriaceae bacterium]